jgi:hypothetical protein
MLKNTYFRNLCEQEFNQLVKAIGSIEAKSEKIFKGLVTIQFEEIVRELLSLLKVREMQISPNSYQQCLKIFRRLIELEN